VHPSRQFRGLGSRVVENASILQERLFDHRRQRCSRDHEGFLLYDLMYQRRTIMVPMTTNKVCEPQHLVSVQSMMNWNYFEGGATPLSCRAWTLQEKILSPKIIHFTPTELVWERETGMVTESCRSHFPRNRTLTDDFGEYSTVWKDLVRDYAKRSITKIPIDLSLSQPLREKFICTPTGLI
jgi:hypothetical protein